MLLDLTLKLLRDILEKTNFCHVELIDALTPVYIEYDDDLIAKEDIEYPDEFDIVCHNNVSHAELQTIDELLAGYALVEMRIRDGKLEIFQTDREQEEATRAVSARPHETQTRRMATHGRTLPRPHPSGSSHELGPLRVVGDSLQHPYYVTVAH